MTVQQMIDALSKINPSAVVCLSVEELTYSEIDGVKDATEHHGVALLTLDPQSEVARALNPSTFDTSIYRDAVNGDGPLAGQWADKPHRLVYDLCRYIEGS